MQKSEPKEGYEYDASKRALASRYESVKLRLGFIDGTLVPIAFSLILLFSGASTQLSRLLSTTVSSYWVSLGLYLIIFIVLLTVVEAPFSFYSGFIVDHRFSLSTQNVKGWFLDEVKGLGVEVVFAVLAGAILYYHHNNAVVVDRRGSNIRRILNIPLNNSTLRNLTDLLQSNPHLR